MLARATSLLRIWSTLTFQHTWHSLHTFCYTYCNFIYSQYKITEIFAISNKKIYLQKCNKRKKKKKVIKIIDFFFSICWYLILNISEHHYYIIMISEHHHYLNKLFIILLCNKLNLITLLPWVILINIFIYSLKFKVTMNVNKK